MLPICKRPKTEEAEDRAAKRETEAEPGREGDSAAHSLSPNSSRRQPLDANSLEATATRRKVAKGDSHPTQSRLRRQLLDATSLEALAVRRKVARGNSRSTQSRLKGQPLDGNSL